MSVSELYIKAEHKPLTWESLKTQLECTFCTGCAARSLAQPNNNNNNNNNNHSSRSTGRKQVDISGKVKTEGGQVNLSGAGCQSRCRIGRDRLGPTTACREQVIIAHLYNRKRQWCEISTGCRSWRRPGSHARLNVRFLPGGQAKPAVRR